MKSRDSFRIKQKKTSQIPNSFPFLSLPFLAGSLDFAFQLHAWMDEYMDAICLSSSAAATPTQFVLLLLPGNLLLEEWPSWGEKKRVREFDKGL